MGNLIKKILMRKCREIYPVAFGFNISYCYTVKDIKSCKIREIFVNSKDLFKVRLVYKFYFYKRFNHEESYCAVKINHRNLIKFVRTVNYLRVVDCTHDAVK